MGGASMGGASGSAGMGSGGASALSSGCGKAPTIASSQYNNGHHITITAAGLQREYILNVPTNYDNTHPYKLSHPLIQPCLPAVQYERRTG
jgi:hypothetical protein